ncbi:alpha-amylase family glycosyl hydrolase [Echinicola jeungdonensis]|uniref:Alpha-amylase family glycosyl hydrolase n=1 Tax=Echinicola jeungdonensis TaxID=709343 RepID=A0ABV5J4D3_9BACT|nr:alpha-amylase family glycosyl hydrolase [Echinicola jeungdonensis]MDN3667903.1 alpha-amylase family glycosyl hydrolase [Echinicola jeungdonensis]
MRIQNNLNLILVFILWLLCFQVKAQVQTQPAFPEANQSVKIIYDASMGTSGLEGEDQVYIHIGAVTESPSSTVWSIVPFEWGTDDPAAQMTRVEGETDIWEFELTPNSFFENPNSETIYRLGMVFRNADGSKEGKSDSNGDIFVDLAQGFELNFLQPQSESQLLEIGEELQIEIISSQEAQISLSINGNELATVTSSTSLTHTFSASSSGLFEVEARAMAGEETVTQTIYLTVAGESPVLPLPAGAKKGINYVSDTETTLVLEAPGKENAFVIGDFNGWKILPEYQMNQTPDGELFWYHLTGLEPQKEYIFQYLVDGNIRIADPYADKISDPYHDQEIIDQNRHPGLLPYPGDKTNFQASFLQTAQEEFNWQYTDYEKPAPEELVIYELLVRDFDERRTYKAVIEKLDYLQDLGINALELMPIMEFEGNISWGYNPSFFFAPDKYYGSKDDLKTLIDEAHKRGMVVILDMVLNHAFGQSPLVRLYNEGDYGAPTAENPWLNTVAKHPFNVGYDFNHESTYTQDLVDSVNHYWLSEYHFDGYRFDLSKGFTQKDYGNDVEQWSQKDDSRIALLKRMYEEIQSHHPEAYVILEHLAVNSEEKILADHGLMLWGNMNHTFREMAKGQSRDFSYGYFQERAWQENNLVGYMESHDEERLMWETLNFGDRSIVDLQALPNAINRNQLLTAFYFGIPAPKMIWQFGELGYDEELNNDRLGIKPTHWEYLENEERQRLFHLYKAMIQLKNGYQVMNQPDNVSLDLEGKVKTIWLGDEALNVVIVGNFGLTNANQVSLAFPFEGTWYNYLNGDEWQVEGNSKEIELGVNEFYILTDQSLPMPEGQILEENLITAIPEKGGRGQELKLYPVPATDKLHVKVPGNMVDFRYRILDMHGKVHREGVNYGNDNILGFQLKDIRAGLYIFELYDNRHLLRKQFIKQ